MYWLIIVLAGIIGGLFSGMFGIGGGIVIVPILTLFTKLSQFTAQGICLASLIGPVSLLALINYYNKGHVKIKEAIIIATLIFLFSYIGSKISLQLPMKTVTKLFGILVVITGLHMILK